MQASGGSGTTGGGVGARSPALELHWAWFVRRGLAGAQCDGDLPGGEDRVSRRVRACAAFEREFNGIQKFEPISRSHDGFVDVLQIGRGAEYFCYVMELADDVGPA